MSTSLSPERARQLAHGLSIYQHAHCAQCDDLTLDSHGVCAKCQQQDSDVARLLEARAALERLAVLEARVQKLTEYLEQHREELVVGPLHDVAAILKGDDQ